MGSTSAEQISRPHRSTVATARPSYVARHRVLCTTACRDSQTAQPCPRVSALRLALPLARGRLLFQAQQERSESAARAQQEQQERSKSEAPSERCQHHESSHKAQSMRAPSLGSRITCHHRSSGCTWRAVRGVEAQRAERVGECSGRQATHGGRCAGWLLADEASVERCAAAPLGLLTTRSVETTSRES